MDLILPLFFRHDFPIKGIEILTSTNKAYELKKQGQAGEGYEMVIIPPPAANIEGMYEVPLAPSAKQPLPPTPPPPAQPKGEDELYETIPGDK